MPPNPSPKTDGDDADRRQAAGMGRYAGVGLQFAVSVIVFLYAGRWVDQRFGSDPWGVIVGVFVGGSAAFYSMYRRLMGDLQRDEAERRR